MTKYNKKGINIVDNYETVDEKASEWELSIRHVQYLCRTGKIGAIKRAGLWFIPKNKENPSKNTKLNEENFDFVGTKKMIFDKAIELFSMNGFDKVSLRHIADSLSIQQSSIYNHFKSKQDILNTIFRFYSYYYLECRPSLVELESGWDLEKKWQREDILQVIHAFQYSFKDEYLQKMSEITTIVFHRIGIDEYAKKIAKTLMVDEGIGYVESVFQRIIDLGKLAPFDTRAMALFLNSTRIFILYNWIISPSEENMKKLSEDEEVLYKHTAGLLENLSL